METRICSQCKIEKPLTNDFFNTKDKLKKKFRTDCKECQNLKQSESYYKKREKYRIAQKIYRDNLRKENQNLLWQFMLKNPCVRCGETNPVVLELDHISNKKYTVSDILYCHSWDSVKEEINKCQVLCSNCHQKKTAKDFNFYKYIDNIDEYL